MHIFLIVVDFPLARHNSMLNILSAEKKRFTGQQKCFVLLEMFNAFSSCFSIRFFKNFAVTFMLFTKCLFWCSCFHLILESCSSSVDASTVCPFLFFVLNALLHRKHRLTILGFRLTATFSLKAFC